MNRVEVLKEKLILQIRAGQILENEYNDKIKGPLYSDRKRVIKGRIESILKEIEDFGLQHINQWTIEILHKNEVTTSMTMELDSSITLEEIISRMNLSQVNVISGKLVSKKMTKFPRLQNEY